MKLYNVAVLLEYKYITSYTLYEDDIKKMIRLAKKHRNALTAECNGDWYDRINFREESVSRKGSKAYNYIDKIEKEIKKIVKKISSGTLYVDFQYDPRGYTVKIRKKKDRKRGFETSYSGFFFD